MTLGPNEDWKESEVCKIVRILAEAGDVPGDMEGRRLALLTRVGDCVAAQGWVFQPRGGEKIRLGRGRSASDDLLAWESAGFRGEAFRLGDVPFDRSERRMVDLIFRHSPWLDGSEPLQGTHDPSAAIKPVRTIQVLAGLLEGQSRKAIADKLGISVNTVAGYAKEIYRLHRVRSQAMLIGVFATGGNKK